jgi:hypothetical protein
VVASILDVAMLVNATTVENIPMIAVTSAIVFTIAVTNATARRAVITASARGRTTSARLARRHTMPMKNVPVLAPALRVVLRAPLLLDPGAPVEKKVSTSTVEVLMAKLLAI